MTLVEINKEISMRISEFEKEISLFKEEGNNIYYSNKDIMSTIIFAKDRIFYMHNNIEVFSRKTISTFCKNAIRFIVTNKLERINLIKDASNLGFKINYKEYYQWEIQKILRDEFDIEVFVKSSYEKGVKKGFYYGVGLEESKPIYKFYEQALEKGLQEALELIKKIRYGTSRRV